MQEQKKVTKDSIVNKMIEYIASDCILFRQEEPKELFDLEKEKWDYVVVWAQKIGLNVQVTTGLFCQDLDEQSKVKLRELLSDLTLEQLLYFQNLAGVYRSVLLALAVKNNVLDYDTAFDLSCIEETFQQKVWKADDIIINEQNRRRDAAKEAYKGMLS
ncbi:MAG: hypothetical protein MJ247_02280 [Alphaproteobacteria bacterium]|nr:hypothetical protein [Alphaproteobacteria bacterium]